MTRATKWALAAGILALALLVALLPRLGVDPAQGPGAGADRDDDGLAEARARADLARCPSGGAPEPSGTDDPDDAAGAGGAAEVPALDGVRVTCLGDGAPVAMDAATGGEVTLINVWATWCEPCREELPLLQGYAARPDAARVLLVQVQSSQVDGLDLLDELGVRLPSVHDGEGMRGPVRDALDVPPMLPASYVVGADGDVEFVTEPRLFTSLEQVSGVVERLR
ncbi:TlpA family protein disulfide reductase [Saccharomonospora iraqiensis]|uniref:TlpA family protein disulfide reductase n=1 Tax=Saccharomonospora iraqiensis TaxID=52698 RepID=UPI00022DFC54|nr:TlpA disulfide reductase family protein [Saccharomonospora iraqiensis]